MIHPSFLRLVTTILVTSARVAIMTALVMGVGGTSISSAVRFAVMTTAVIRSRIPGMLLSKRWYCQNQRQYRNCEDLQYFHGRDSFEKQTSPVDRIQHGDLLRMV